jgi:hypothetical protein
MMAIGIVNSMMTPRSFKRSERIATNTATPGINLSPERLQRGYRFGDDSLPVQTQATAYGMTDHNWAEFAVYPKSLMIVGS